MEEKEQSHVGRMDFERDILDKAVETGKALTEAELDRSTTAFMTLLFERFNVMSLRESRRSERVESHALSILQCTSRTWGKQKRYVLIRNRGGLPKCKPFGAR